ncbi:hypothetical protein NHQ30_008993 [Ciborinia camelliae]|nr:hypothetical protein NHQ30_008993 [Ciborinia camelliae]
MILAVIMLLASAAAQQPVYGQCGGIGWTSGTTCIIGSTCVYQNPYYSQCLPGAASSTSSSKTTTSAPGTSKTSTISTTSITTTKTERKGPTSTAAVDGDSYSQTGFDPTLTQPAAENPLGNPNLQGYTTTGGLNWASRTRSLNVSFADERIMDSYFAEVQKLYNAGGRNFLFLTVPPTEDSPLFIAQGTAVQASLATAISQYNAAIMSRVAAFKAANAGSTTWVYDTQTPFLAAINNPTAYGSVDSTCINADGVSCLWWNNYHPGQIIHKLIAQGIAALLNGAFW